jgi:uncharacterized protein YcbX
MMQQYRTSMLSFTGFAFDRWWMVVNDKGRMLTQRQAPKLALVETALPPEAIEEGAWKPLPPDAALSELPFKR